MNKIKSSELNKIEALLIKKALLASKKSYSPYSRFSVGVALLCEDNKLVLASNLENAAYGSSICAEGAALAKFKSSDFKKIEKMAIIGLSKDKNINEIISPCGNCRQIMFEIFKESGSNPDILMSDSDIKYLVKCKIDDLLPLAFGPSNF